MRRIIIGWSVCSLGVLAALNATSVLAAEPGQVQFNNRCRTCHSVREGDHRLGPSLYRVYGRVAGTSSFPAYSDAMKNAGFEWDEEKLNRYIENPDNVVPGHNMRPFPGVSDPAEREKIVGYLKAQTEKDSQTSQTAEAK
jgi:cytochrome c